MLEHAFREAFYRGANAKFNNDLGDYIMIQVCQTRQGFFCLLKEGAKKIITGTVMTQGNKINVKTI